MMLDKIKKTATDICIAIGVAIGVATVVTIIVVAIAVDLGFRWGI